MENILLLRLQSAIRHIEQGRLEDAINILNTTKELIVGLDQDLSKEPTYETLSGRGSKESEFSKGTTIKTFDGKNYSTKVIPKDHTITAAYQLNCGCPIEILHCTLCNNCINHCPCTNEDRLKGLAKWLEEQQTELLDIYLKNRA